MDTLDDIMMTQSPTARRPLLGLTVLMVEDSRYACEAVRLLCLRSGARIRRADSLENARRHLAVYRPSVLLVDVGLPDGSGVALIETLAAAKPRIDVILGISGDPNANDAVMQAGADGFVEKPISNLASFQAAILAHLPADRQPPGPRQINDEAVKPDPIAYQDDLAHIAQILDEAADGTNLAYVTQFLGGVARSAQDHDLDRAVTDLANMQRSGTDFRKGVINLSAMVQSRLSAAGMV
ncbi:response regulator [Yoonia sp. SS1-5]|uniref:Response regulator n=1 Tax=Yoonia rhodophyticola TaxID=3137370 RepID=A0AAN0MD71_9RHOB